jgi:hypothetical protein
MIPTLLFYFILAATTSPTPSYPAPSSFTEIVPWVLGFMATIVSGLLYHNVYGNSKRMDSMDQRIDKLADAVYLSNKARLLQMAADPDLHPLLKEQCNTLVREIEDATKK